MKENEVKSRKIIWSFRENARDLRALARFAFQFDRAVMILHGVLDDGQAQSRTAGGLGVALVHPVEAFEHPGLILRRNADAGVRHLYDRGFFVGVHEEMHAAAGDIVLDGIVTEVVEDFIQKPPHALDGGRLAFHHQRDLFLGGFVLQAVCDLFRQGEQFHLFPGHFVPFVQLGQADDIADQCHHPGGFRANLPDEVGHVLRLHHALFDQLGAAQNALQRRFQLMRHIGGELPAVALGVLLLCHIEGQQHCTHRRIGCGSYPADTPGHYAGSAAGCGPSPGLSPSQGTAHGCGPPSGSHGPHSPRPPERACRRRG